MAFPRGTPRAADGDPWRATADGQGCIRRGCQPIITAVGGGRQVLGDATGNGVADFVQSPSQPGLSAPATWS
jgi:hypothetical protein